MLSPVQGKIKAMFLPPNTTFIIQPMDQAVLDPCKRRYKRKLLLHIILEDESEDKSVPEILKSVTMKDVVYQIAAAWEEATNDSLRKAWQNLLPEPTGDSEIAGSEQLDAEVDEMPDSLNSLGPDAVSQWMEADSNEPGHEMMTDNEIVAELIATDEEGDSSDEDEDMAVPPPVTPSAAFDALDTSLRWLESQNTDVEHFLIKKWQDHVAWMRRECLKQKTITSFFPRN